MDDFSAIQGTWQIVKAELAGEEMPAFVAEKIEITMKAGDYVVRFSGDVSDRGTYALGTDGAAKTIHLSGIEGTNAGRTIPAIYQLVGGRLRVCYGLDGISPTEFVTKPGQQCYLAMYRRM